MENINIEKITIDQIDQLQKICRQTFYETFAISNSEENMQKYLSESFSIENLNNELKNENSEFYFAKDNDKIIGYLKLNFVAYKSEPKNDRTLEIERIYVFKEYHGKKVGQVLLNKAIEIAKQKEAEFVWLCVWEENPRAITFYKKNGFVEFDKHIFKLGDDEQTDIVMKLKLNFM